ncbi:flagellar motor protein MotD [Sulfuriferula nivalis]|uniref:Flagellar motor protein MotD n=1 Tax=Sulfuriferula nivalis TaxID=2675298 RepID=A0A809RHP5_9PROT|nr:flagellar motor protein MotD [Sulfuriferula nivalis]BBP01136.1 flagellar motor protein MotD [Sulfuriferula nivalis]
MSRRKRRQGDDDEEHDNLDRWLVSYADFMTLLFAFFVVMYAISAVNVGKYKVLSESLGSAFGSASEQNPGSSKNKSKAITNKSNDSTVIRQERSQMTNVANDILHALSPLIREGKVRVTQTAHGVSIEINASLLFAPGDAKLAAESRQALGAIANVLKMQRNDIEIDGYTDDVPISNSAFASNWELSAVRASSVAREFMNNGVAENRLMVVGNGPNKPIMPNDTAENRARNRRVEVVILSNLPEAARETTLVAPIVH